MSDSPDGTPDTSESGSESPAATTSQALTENSERLDQLEEILRTERGEDPKFPTAVVTVFDIKCPVMETYLVVADNPQSTSEELADILEYDRHGVNRYLRDLLDKGLVSRERAVDGKPGITYEYTAKPFDEATDWMQAEMEAWSADVIEEIETLHEHYSDRSQDTESA